MDQCIHTLMHRAILCAMILSCSNIIQNFLIPKCINTPIYWFTNALMQQYINAPRHQFINEPMHTCTNAPIQSYVQWYCSVFILLSILYCINITIHYFTITLIKKCTNTKIHQCTSARMQSCILWHSPVQILLCVLYCIYFVIRITT